MILPPEQRERCFLTREFCPAYRKAIIIDAYKRLLAGEAKSGKAYIRAMAKRVDERNNSVGINLSMLQHYDSRIKYNKPDTIRQHAEPTTSELEKDLEVDDEPEEPEEPIEEPEEGETTTDSGSLLDVIPPSLLKRIIGDIE